MSTPRQPATNTPTSTNLATVIASSPFSTLPTLFSLHTPLLPDLSLLVLSFLADQFARWMPARPTAPKELLIVHSTPHPRIVAPDRTKQMFTLTWKHADTQEQKERKQVNNQKCEADVDGYMCEGIWHDRQHIVMETGLYIDDRLLISASKLSKLRTYLNAHDINNTRDDDDDVHTFTIFPSLITPMRGVMRNIQIRYHDENKDEQEHDVDAMLQHARRRELRYLTDRPGLYTHHWRTYQQHDDPSYDLDYKPQHEHVHDDDIDKHPYTYDPLVWHSHPCLFSTAMRVCSVIAPPCELEYEQATCWTYRYRVYRTIVACCDLLHTEVDDKQQQQQEQKELQQPSTKPRTETFTCTQAQAQASSHQQPHHPRWYHRVTHGGYSEWLTTSVWIRIRPYARTWDGELNGVSLVIE